MSYKSLLKEFYTNDGLRDIDKLNDLLHDDFSLEWDSTSQKGIYSKKDILNIAKELKTNYDASIIEIKTIIEEENKVALRYFHNMSPIEDPNRVTLVAKVVVFWEFQDNKIIKGYQITRST